MSSALDDPVRQAPVSARQVLQDVFGYPAFRGQQAAIAKYGIEKDIGYISTGGGAFLEVLEGKTLPAFEILSRRAAQN